MIDHYDTYHTIDEKFYQLNQALKKSYYTNTDIDTESPPLYPTSYIPPKKPYEFNVITDYYGKTTIDQKFHALDQELDKFYYKKREEKSTELRFKAMNYDNYDTP